MREKGFVSSEDQYSSPQRAIASTLGDTITATPLVKSQQQTAAIFVVDQKAKASSKLPLPQIPPISSAVQNSPIHRCPEASYPPSVVDHPSPQDCVVAKLR